MQAQPGNVKLHQEHVKQGIGSKDSKPVFFVIHGGYGSHKQEYLDSIGHVVVKVNLDVRLVMEAGLRRFQPLLTSFPSIRSVSRACADHVISSD